MCSLELGWPGEPLSVPVLAASRARRDTDLHPPRPSVPLSPPSCEPARSGSWGLYKGRETSASSKESLGAGGALPPSCLHVIQLPQARTSLAVSTELSRHCVREPPASGPDGGSGPRERGCPILSFHRSGGKRCMGALSHHIALGRVSPILSLQRTRGNCGGVPFHPTASHGTFPVAAGWTGSSSRLRPARGKSAHLGGAVRVVGRPHGRGLGPLRSAGAPRCSSTHGAGACPCGFGSGVCSGQEECWKWVSPDVGPSGSSGPVLGLMHSIVGWGPCPSWAAGPEVLGKGNLDNMGGVQGEQWSRRVLLELSPAPGRLDSSCFPSSVSPGPVHADTRACPQASLC